MIANAISTAQYTIVDYSDAVSLFSHIECNTSRTQIYNSENDTYSPDWRNNNVTLTPVLYITGTTEDVITTPNVLSVEWNINGEIIVNSDKFELSGEKNHILKIKDNILSSDTSLDFECSITYIDTKSGLDIIEKTDISFSRISSGSNVYKTNIWCPYGNLFKNNETKVLQATMELWLASEIVNNNVNYQWYIQNSSINIDQGAGIGWERLSDREEMYTGTNTKTISIYPNAVHNYAVFKCIVTITNFDSNGDKVFYDTVTFIDNSDPIQVKVFSSNGTIFKNNKINSVLTAKVYKGGKEIDLNATLYTYRWFKYDSNGNLVNNFGGNVSYKTGKTLLVTNNDVDNKAKFSVEVYDKK